MSDDQKFTNKSLGAFGEEIAATYLKRLRFKIIERNYSCKSGEIDIVAIDGKTLVFVEVKTRKNCSYGPPQLSVTQFKQRQISKAALTYVTAKKLGDMNARFDVVAVLLREQERPQIDHIKNAFDLSY